MVALGESLLRMSVPDHGRLESMSGLTVDIGGAEMNTLIGVSRLGGTATWLTRLGDNPLGRRIVNHAAAHGVRAVVDWDSAARTPLYFVEHGLPPRPSQVLYDRKHSAMHQLRPDHFPWVDMVADADVAFTTGITCALGKHPAEAVAAFLAAATQVGCRTAFDLNYRSLLWTWEQAIDCLRQLLPSIDLLFAGPRELQHLYGVELRDPVELARKTIFDGGPSTVILRETSRRPGRNVSVRVTAVTAEHAVSSGELHAEVLDPFGAGDAAAAAFLTRWRQHDDLAAAAEFAAWAAAVQHTIPGDAWVVHADDFDRARDSASSTGILR